MTFPLPQTINAPIGAKMSPTRSNVGSTALGVRIGCQALRRCCLKAVSEFQSLTVERIILLAGLLENLTFSFCVAVPSTGCLSLLFRLNRGILDQQRGGTKMPGRGNINKGLPILRAWFATSRGRVGVDRINSTGVTKVTLLLMQTTF